MNIKVEIVKHDAAFVGLNRRPMPRFKVMGYVKLGDGGWAGAELVNGPWGETDGGNGFTKTVAMQVASLFLSMSDEMARKLVLG